jgi:hypothetical protein
MALHALISYYMRTKPLHQTLTSSSTTTSSATVSPSEIHTSTAMQCQLIKHSAQASIDAVSIRYYHGFTSLSRMSLTWSSHAALQCQTANNFKLTNKDGSCIALVCIRQRRIYTAFTNDLLKIQNDTQIEHHSLKMYHC